MEEKDKIPSEEADATPEGTGSVKPAWQQTKENWYDHVPLTVRQLDIIIACGIGGLIITAIVIALDAMGVF